MSTLRSMKLLWSSAGFLGWVLAAGAWAQAEPAKAAGYQDQNTVLAVVGSRMVTLWEVMQFMDRNQSERDKRKGLRRPSEEFKSNADELGKVKERLAAASPEDREQLEAKHARLDSGMSAMLSELKLHQGKLISDLLLIEQVKADPLYREPPGVVDYYLASRVKEKKGRLDRHHS